MIYYQDVLSTEHLLNNELKIDKVSFPDGGTDEKYNFWGFELQKEGRRYLLPSKRPDGTDINVFDLLPIVPKDVQKVAHGGNVYYLINKPVSVNFKPLKKMSFKDFVDKLNDFERSNKSHGRLMVLMALAQTIDRANFRICSPPGFGKDSVVDIFGNLFGKCATIENPTIAKLEYMTSMKWLAVNEIVDISKAEWRNIEQFLLSAGAHKPEITKHSRANSNGVKEILDISKFSLSLMYNDINCYPDSKEYVDFIAKKAVLDRFPAFRFNGIITEDFNQIKGVDTKQFVTEHFEEYKDLIYTFNYFKLNLSKELKHYNANALISMPPRWKTNIARLLKMCDLYSESQEEFDNFINEINYSLTDYADQLEYVKLIKLAEKKGKDLPKDLYTCSTFTQKNKIINDLISNKPTSQSNTLWD